MAKLIILRGNSGSGKSTVARMLQKKCGPGTLLISQDTVRREMLCAHDKPGTPALPLLQNLMAYGSAHCETVILEGILRSDSYMPLFEYAVDSFDTIFAYYYDLPFEETLARHKTKSVKAEFGEANMRSWWREKDYIGIIPEKIRTKDMTLADTVDMVYLDIQTGIDVNS